MAAKHIASCGTLWYPDARSPALATQMLVTMRVAPTNCDRVTSRPKRCFKTNVRWSNQTCKRFHYYPGSGKRNERAIFLIVVHLILTHVGLWISCYNNKKIDKHFLFDTSSLHIYIIPPCTRASWLASSRRWVWSRWAVRPSWGCTGTGCYWPHSRCLAPWKGGSTTLCLWTLQESPLCLWKWDRDDGIFTKSCQPLIKSTRQKRQKRAFSQI